MRAALGSLIVTASDDDQSLIYRPSYFKYCRSLHPLSSFVSSGILQHYNYCELFIGFIG